MSTLLCLVRHGVTDWNYEGRAQGQSDIPLNLEGRAQAAAVAERLGNEAWDAIYSSPLVRASATAQAIAANAGLTVVTDPRLQERFMGLAEGSTHADRLMRWPNGDWRTASGAETDARLAARARDVLSEIAARHEGQRVICVAHGGLIAVFLQLLQAEAGRPPERIIPGNTGVTLVRWQNGSFAIESLPDDRHLLDGGFYFTGEKWRVRILGLERLAEHLEHRLSQQALDTAVGNASAVESAWVADDMVAFIRCFTDGVWQGYVDLELTRPGYEMLLPVLLERLKARYPGVSFARLALSGAEPLETERA